MTPSTKSGCTDVGCPDEEIDGPNIDNDDVGGPNIDDVAVVVADTAIGG